MSNRTFVIAKDFSAAPGPRRKSDGSYSGEALREILLDFLDNSADIITIDFDGTRGYSSSFLEEAFGGLLRAGRSKEELANRLRFKSINDLSIALEVTDYINMASDMHEPRMDQCVADTQHWEKELSVRGEKVALYAGSFDPITLGHIDIVRQAQVVFDKVFIMIGKNPRKSRLIPLDQSLILIEQTLHEQGLDVTRCRFGNYDGSLMEIARKISPTAIVRGLRQASDFNDEFMINGVCASTIPHIPITYFICDSRYLHVSSSTAKELASHGEDINWLVSPCVEDVLNQLYDSSK